MSTKNHSAKPIYLGDIQVVPRSRGKRIFDFELPGSTNVDSAIADMIRDALALRTEREIERLPDSYLVIDLIVMDYTRGTSNSLWETEIALIGFLFRPKIVIASRLREGPSGEVLFRTKSSKRMTLLAYIADSIDLRTAIRLSERDDDTLNHLMLKCLFENMSKVKAYLGGGSESVE